jgi:hypothetical protein
VPFSRSENRWRPRGALQVIVLIVLIAFVFVFVNIPAMFIIWPRAKASRPFLFEKAENVDFVAIRGNMCCGDSLIIARGVDVVAVLLDQAADRSHVAAQDRCSEKADSFNFEVWVVRALL